MEFLPKTLGTRPRLACEIRAEGVVAARAEDASGLLSSVSHVTLPEGVAAPRAGDGADLLGGGRAGRAAIVAAVRKVLEAVSLRTREVTLVVPDAAVRVLLLDFDALPGKPAEALAVVRFRLKKLLPFDADDAAVSYQVMAASKDALHVVAVAMPGNVLADYESVVREAGFEPGAILPSTLAALAALDERQGPMLIVNASQEGVTTAIVKAGVLLLHRSVDLRAEFPTDFAARNLPSDDAGKRVPLVDRESSAQEWALQQPVTFRDSANPVAAAAPMHTAVIEHERVPVVAEAGEVAQAVSVAAAYFEDTLESPPAVVLAAGTLGAEALIAVLDEAYVGPVAVQEIVDRQMLSADPASIASIPPGWLAGVRGALAN